MVDSSFVQFGKNGSELVCSSGGEARGLEHPRIGDVFHDHTIWTDGVFNKILEICFPALGIGINVLDQSVEIKGNRSFRRVQVPSADSKRDLPRGMDRFHDHWNACESFLDNDTVPSQKLDCLTGSL